MTTANPLTIGTIGTGRMAGTLGRIWAANGHRVMFGSRDPAKARALAAETGHDAQGGSQTEAAVFGEVVLLATPWTGAQAAVQNLPLDGKVLIDVTNPYHPDQGLLVGHTTSAAELIAARAPGARVIKAFNAIHFTNLDHPDFDGQKPAVFYCGDDPHAKGIVRELIEATGCTPVNVGPLRRARYLEPLAALWIDLAFQERWGTDFAFMVLGRSTTP
jgi:predicted dinucleotide-binding enzyme